MNEREYIINLYDFYGELFNETQKLYFEEYYFSNLSLSEIGINHNVSRNAIHKQIKSLNEKLKYYEEKLELYKKYLKLDKIIKDINDVKLQKLLKDLF